MKVFDKHYYSKQVRHKMVRDFLIIFYTIGLFGLNIQLTEWLFVKLIPFTILLSFFILMGFHKQWTLKFTLAALVVAFLGFMVEAVGVHTKIIFGEYFYGPNLGLKIWDTPLLIGVNWLMLTYIAYIVFQSTDWHLLLKILAGALLLVIYDFFMEPMAIKLDMWDWAGSVVPIKNYVAWFILSVIFISFFHILKLKISNKIALTVFLVQLGFFIILNIISLTRMNETL